MRAVLSILDGHLWASLAFVFCQKQHAPMLIVSLAILEIAYKKNRVD